MTDRLKLADECTCRVVKSEFGEPDYTVVCAKCLRATAPLDAGRREALKACRLEIERQRDRCNSDQEVQPYQALLDQVDALPQGKQPEGTTEALATKLRETAGKLINGDIEDGSVETAMLCEAADALAIPQPGAEPISPVMKSADHAMKVVESWSYSKREYADRVIGAAPSPALDLATGEALQALSECRDFVSDVAGDAANGPRTLSHARDLRASALAAIETIEAALALATNAKTPGNAEAVREFCDFTVGDKVRKLSGYEFPGVLVGIVKKMDGTPRAIVECTAPGCAGMLHIFNFNQIALSPTTNQTEGGK